MNGSAGAKLRSSKKRFAIGSADSRALTPIHCIRTQTALPPSSHFGPPFHKAHALGSVLQKVVNFEQSGVLRLLML